MVYGSAGVESVYVRKNNVAVDSYSETNQDSAFILNNTTPNFISSSAQSFTNTYTSFLTSCKFYLRKYNAPTGNIYAKLYAHTGVYGTSSKPTGSALATSAAIDASTLTTSYQLITFTFATPYKMTAGTYYCIALEHATSGATNQVWLGSDTSSVSGIGNMAYLNSSAGTWTVSTAYDLCFYVYATEEKDITGYHYEHKITQRLNQLWNFDLKLVNVSSADKVYWILENNEILVFWGTICRMKGRIETIEYDNYEICTITGVGTAVKLRDRDIDEEYLNTNSNTIVTNIVGSLMTVDTNTNYGLISMHFASDNRLRSLAGTVQAIDYEWWENWKSADDYNANYINVDDWKSDPAVTKMTFASSGASQNMHVISEEVDTYETTNYVTCLGMGDGINQLKSISYHATDNRTTLKYPLDTTLFTACVAETGAGKFIYVYEKSGFEVNDVVSIDGESMTITAISGTAEIDGSWKLTVTRPASAQVHSAGASIIKTSGKVFCNSTTTLPTVNPSYVWVGQEKIKYTANDTVNNTLTLDATYRGSSTQVFLQDRIVKPYIHMTNAEVWDATYSDSAPEVGSYIATDGIRSRTFSDVSIIQQDMLDYLAQRIRVDRQDKVSMVKVKGSDAYSVLVTTGLTVGDWVELADTYTQFVVGTRYEVVGMIYGFSIDEGEYCEVEISNYNASLLENTVKETDNLGKYYKGATNVYQVDGLDNCGVGYPLEMPFYIPDDAAAINKVLLSYGVSNYRAFNSTTTSSGGSVATSGDGSTMVVAAATLSTASAVDLSSGFATVATYSESTHGSLWCFYVGARNSSTGSGTVYCRVKRGGTYYPNSTGIRTYFQDGNDIIAYPTADFFILVPGDQYGQTLEVQLSCTGVSSASAYTGRWIIGQHTHSVTIPDHTHGVSYGISESIGAVTNVDIYIDDGNGYPVSPQLTYASSATQQNVDITNYVGRQTGWKKVKIQPNGNCRIRGNVFIKTFVQSTT